MDLAQFRAEAETLARSATLLTTRGGGEPAAYWHGLQPGTPCISLVHKGRWLNVHVGGTEDYVETTPTPVRSSTRLFAEQITSLPPVDAVFLLGSAAIEAYLRQHGWERTEPFNDNFPDRIPGLYERQWQASCPMYADDAVAARGGWHFPWPDGDFRELVDSELVVWTIRDAEPWIEVFEKGGTYSVKTRVT